MNSNIVTIVSVHGEDAFVTAEGDDRDYLHSILGMQPVLFVQCVSRSIKHFSCVKDVRAG